MASQRGPEPGRPPNGKIVRLIDNHLLIDLAQAVYPDRSAAHHELRRKIREPVFNAARELAQKGRTILMTACLAENDGDVAVFQEQLGMVRGTAIPLSWANLHCEQAVLEQRVASEERRDGTKTKLTDVAVVRKLVSEHRLLRPSRHDVESATLVIETLDSTAEEKG
ncbi:Chloramphenicol phosphotransferase-like protein [Tolypocladium paradoxum]|uniref:Chloramphenicol phosphotransferase-like protein n=1 Tax=Tolypocladium paradoxum TaxID=94208 RepID=A0A2S4KL28_9HYPO|nr:Chloramphenicol phosphotransferase-like protein [Tolypocladium paradoxum]